MVKDYISHTATQDNHLVPSIHLNGKSRRYYVLPESKVSFRPRIDTESKDLCSVPESTTLGRVLPFHKEETEKLTDTYTLKIFARKKTLRFH